MGKQMQVARLLVCFCMLSMVCGCSSFGKKTLTIDGQDYRLAFEEDFSQGRDRWVATDDSAWKIIDEDGNKVFSLFKMSKYEPPVRSPYNIARVADLLAGDFVIDVRMEQTGKAYAHRDMCLFFGYQGPAQYYYVHIATHADAAANSVFIVNDAPRVSIASERTEGTDWATGYHDVRIVREASSGLIEVYFDDMTRPIMKAKDTTFGEGGIGFGSFDDTGKIDDVRVWTRKKGPLFYMKRLPVFGYLFRWS